MTSIISNIDAESARDNSYLYHKDHEVFRSILGRIDKASQKGEVVLTLSGTDSDFVLQIGVLSAFKYLGFKIDTIGSIVDISWSA